MVETMSRGTDKPTKKERLAFGQRVREARDRARMTQEDLAQRTGFTRGAIGMIETGMSYSTAPGRAAIAAALGVRPEALITPRKSRK